MAEVERRHPVHVRRITCEGFRREDGLVDIEGRLHDPAVHASQLRFHAVPAGASIHDMRLQMTIDRQMQVLRVAARTEAGATPYCGGADPAYAALAGLRIGPGFRRAMRERVGGAAGCTHLTELLSAMAAAAVQTVLALLREQNETRRFAAAVSKPHWIIDTCHAFRSGGPAALRLAEALLRDDPHPSEHNPESEMTQSVKDKVFVVTGAGRGIGREIALLAAREGARVVVNDLGSTPSGEGADRGPAEEVVAEIRAAGGQAVVNGDSVADPDGAARIVQCALDHFDRVDVVVNNAGILRDRIFYRMARDEWDAVIQVHLNGSYYVARAAASHFKEQNGGAYVHFTSTSGLIGNVGQCNYGAAKMGIIGLSKLIALDMKRFNVRSNCIAPAAWSRLIGTIPAETEERKARLERIKSMSADKIAPLAVYLGSDAAGGVNGQVFGVRKNEITLYSQPRPIRSVHRGEGWTTQTLAEHGMPALQGSFVPLHTTAEVMSWEAI